MKLLYWTAYCVLCLGSLAAGSVLGLAASSPLLGQAMKARLGIASNPFEGKDELFILALGCDENRQYGGKVVSEFARTDSIHLVRLDFKNKAIGMLHIPRDTESPLEGHGVTKINGLHVVGGTELTAQAVEELTGIRPDRVVVVNYKSIEKSVDVLGGVELFVPKKMNYDDDAGDLHIHLNPGRQRLTGKQAVGFLRYRRDSDFFRGERQQQFLKAMKQEISRKPDKFTDVVNLISEILSDSLSSEEIVSLAMFVAKVPSSKIKNAMLPVTEGHGTVLVPIESEIPKALVDAGLVKPPATRTRDTSL